MRQAVVLICIHQGGNNAAGKTKENMTKIQDRQNDNQYGFAANGRQVGSGYDVEIKRESRDVAIVCVTNLATKEEWMTLLDVEAHTDLQALACQIGQCPGAELGGMPSADDWDACVDRWNNIELKK